MKVDWNINQFLDKRVAIILVQYIFSLTIVPQMIEVDLKYNMFLLPANHSLTHM